VYIRYNLQSFLTNRNSVLCSFGGRTHKGTSAERTCGSRFSYRTLAHAYFPEDGRIHFNEGFYFTDKTSSGYNLMWIAVHEFGHALGLSHTGEYDAIMYPYYTGYQPNLKLHSDDIAGIQALYGENTDRNKQTNSRNCPLSFLFRLSSTSWARCCFQLTTELTSERKQRKVYYNRTIS